MVSSELTCLTACISEGENRDCLVVFISRVVTLCRMASFSSSVIVALASATSSDATKSIALALAMLKLAPRLITSSWPGVKDFYGTKTKTETSI